MEIFNHTFSHPNARLRLEMSHVVYVPQLHGPRVFVRDARAAGGARGVDGGVLKSGRCIIRDSTTSFLFADVVGLAVNVLRAGGLVSLPTMFLLGILRVMV